MNGEREPAPSMLMSQEWLDAKVASDPTSEVEAGSRCEVPPEGWWCSREPGHEGPCAARAVGEPAPSSIEPTIRVRFQDREWSYHNHIPDLDPGDFVVVPFGNDRFVVGQFLGATNTVAQAKKATKWVVEKVMSDDTMRKWEALTALKPPPTPVEDDKLARVNWYATQALKTFKEAKTADKIPPVAGKLKFRRRGRRAPK